jgi:hypothetical protein
LLALSKKDVREQLNIIEQHNEQRTSSQQALLLDVRDRINNATQHITNGNMSMSKIADALRLDWLRQLGTDLKSLMHKVIATNIATYHAIVSIQTVLSSRLERTLIEEPFILEDPIGRMAPVHLQFVTSWEAFNAVLEIRFRNLQGFKKIQDKHYGLQEKATRRDIDQARPWQQAFLPGQRIEMSFIFHSDSSDEAANETNIVTCPGCRASSTHTSDADTQCSNCMMWFRRVTVITEVEPPPPVPLPNPWKSTAAFGKPSFSMQLSGPLKPGKRRTAENDLEGEDDVREFKRVRLVAQKKLIRRQRFVSHTAQKSFSTFANLPVSANFKTSGSTTQANSAAAIPMKITKLNQREDDALRTQMRLENTLYNSSLPPISNDLLMLSKGIPPGSWSTRGRYSEQEAEESDAGSSPTLSEQEAEVSDTGSSLALSEQGAEESDAGSSFAPSEQGAEESDAGNSPDLVNFMFRRGGARRSRAPEPEDHTQARTSQYPYLGEFLWSDDWSGEHEVLSKDIREFDRRHSLPELYCGYGPFIETTSVPESNKRTNSQLEERRPVETYLYDLLGISDWRVSQDEIANAYERTCTRMLLSQSSDTGLNGTVAAYFSILSEAYRILWHPASRYRYHQLGLTYRTSCCSKRAPSLLEAASNQDIATSADFFALTRPRLSPRERSHWYNRSHVLPDISARLNLLRTSFATAKHSESETIYTRCLPQIRPQILSLNAEERVKRCSISLA